jgi:hypothetical protein
MRFCFAVALAVYRPRPGRQNPAACHFHVLRALGRSPQQAQYTADHTTQKYAGINSTVWSGIFVGLTSQLWLRRYHPGWYRKYNYILGGALDGGAQVMIFVLSFAVFGASGVPRPFPSVELTSLSSSPPSPNRDDLSLPLPSPSFFSAVGGKPHQGKRGLLQWQRGA